MSEHRDSPWRRGRCHALWQHQSGLCFHCGSPMPDPLTQRGRHRKRPNAATIEHVLPRALGGMESWLNEVAACRACNATKADRLPSGMELWRLAWLKREDALPVTAEAAMLMGLLRSARSREERDE
ncbi:MAG: HNH endonuclease [Magnetospirillum sp.]|nr:HNH endonuclease [Magnetospirillum sp.]